jgi:DNA-binding CsgD family transcriptional regulator
MKQNGKTLKEIAAELGVNKYTIQFYLKDVPSPNNKRLTDEQKEEIVALTKNGLSTYQIADKLEISQKTVCHILKKSLVKEKEPASAATDTSSVGCIKKTDGDTVSISKDNTIEAKCQVLAKALKFAHKGILTQYEEMSHECQLAFDLGQLFAEIEQRMKEGGIEVE